MRFQSGDVVSHFKREFVPGDSMEYLYRILEIARHTETEEQLVVYKALYPPYQTYARPYDMFCSEVDREKYPEVKQTYRFEKVSEPVADGSLEAFVEVVARLRAPEGCPWDRQQTHMSLKPACIEEAAEVICGINVLDQTGDADNLKEELGDLLMQVVMHAQIAKETGEFELEDVIKGITEKMIRRHPHVFGSVTVSDAGKVLTNWADIKAKEKAGKASVKEELFAAFEEGKKLLDVAAERKRR